MNTKHVDDKLLYREVLPDQPNQAVKVRELAPHLSLLVHHAPVHLPQLHLHTSLHTNQYVVDLFPALGPIVEQ